MIAIASLMNLEANQQIKEIWDLFETKCNMSEIKQTSLPHFTWQSAEDYRFESIEDTLPTLAAQLFPFTVTTAGIGIFTGNTPLIYLALVKTKIMMDFHQVLWNGLTHSGVAINQHYSPDRWIPHITLAIRDVNSQNLACALDGILHRPYEMEILIDNLAVIYQVENYDGVKVKYNFPSG
ncbi:MAG: 2'-5' RNA ligase family protein [Anaerolineaceae bacterium]|jgi:2'-5' RNA ligase